MAAMYVPMRIIPRADTHTPIQYLRKPLWVFIYSSFCYIRSCANCCIFGVREENSGASRTFQHRDTVRV